MFERVVIIILDACGVGELPDAAEYGDRGAATIPNVAQRVGGLKMPNSALLGLGNIAEITGIAPKANSIGTYGKMAEKSPGKDSTTGHWEIGGVILDHPFPVYPEGFPEGVVREFEQRAGIETIGNIPASGTEIIERLGKEHLQTGKIILYTSADSVFQLAAHEEIIPVPRLYDICRTARKLLTGEHGVGRVIARPFIGEPRHFERTARRKDFSLEPPRKTILDILHENDIPVVAIGKISDLFAGRGISRAIKTKNNSDVTKNVIDQLDKTANGLLFANLVDFDMLWGHRNDYKSFSTGLEEFDRELPKIMDKMNEKDLLIITADHGCDPTLADSTDHTREYVPLLTFGKNAAPGIDLGTRKTFSDIASTLAENFRIDYTFPGKSFYGEISGSRKKE